MTGKYILGWKAAKLPPKRRLLLFVENDSKKNFFSLNWLIKKYLGR